MKNVAVIEFNGWHSDCIYSQVLFLKKKGYTVHLICNKKLEGLIEDIHIADHVMLTDMSLTASVKVWFYLRKHKISKVIFNTAQGSKVLKFCMMPMSSRKIKYFGLIHDLRKLTESSGQKWIMRKVKRYFVLADFLDKNFPDIPGLKHKAMSPVFLPEYRTIPLEKKPGDIWIVIGGSLDFARRDYMALFQEGARYNKNVKFILLGDSKHFDGPEVKRLIKERGMEDSFVLFDHFVPNDEFYSYARLADYIMLLVHEDAGEFDSYLHYKITGSMLIAFALRKPLLCDIAFMQLSDYAHHSVFYRREDLAHMVNNLKTPVVSTNYYNVDFERRYSLGNQASQYVEFIEQE